MWPRSTKFFPSNFAHNHFSLKLNSCKSLVMGSEYLGLLQDYFWNLSIIGVIKDFAQECDPVPQNFFPSNFAHNHFSLKLNSCKSLVMGSEYLGLLQDYFWNLSIIGVIKDFAQECDPVPQNFFPSNFAHNHFSLILKSWKSLVVGSQYFDLLQDYFWNLSNNRGN